MYGAKGVKNCTRALIIPHLRLWVSVWGLGFRVRGFGFRVSGIQVFRFRFSGWEGFRVYGVGSAQLGDMGRHVDGLGFGAWGLVFGVWCLGFRVSGFRFRELGECAVQGVGCGV